MSITASVLACIPGLAAMVTDRREAPAIPAPPGRPDDAPAGGHDPAAQAAPARDPWSGVVASRLSRAALARDDAA
ncbi:hypothetical protein [Roseicella frigidaeris]|uniref:Uncharacterized protein n=1 Tax=Roseicella frigidaeris TaxID=2230885 RepID=A0A327M8H6_9PROT|nr:hypothetical protein [Roseicella frigidaeris]RAI59019.1 hypothetical protein DOO78_10800 [Roseicella frigidaeris]